MEGVPFSPGERTTVHPLAASTGVLDASPTSPGELRHVEITSVPNSVSEALCALLGGGGEAAAAEAAAAEAAAAKAAAAKAAAAEAAAAEAAAAEAAAAEQPRLRRPRLRRSLQRPRRLPTRWQSK